MLKTCMFATLAAAAIAAPAAAQVTSPNPQIAESLRQIELYQQQQRQDELEARVFDLEQQQRTRANERALDLQAARAPDFTFQLVPPAAPSTVADLAETAARRDAALAASQARLQSLADEINN